ncbi:hypothetical protein Fcan01_16125 [Folsomia candida]|uniref:Uncharacterized protein n=1 Tax=Folsomia candida TaxID=158441 RepID=A0A226DSX4_FOLCA|nr:hypothetical protein Fcan01_16125 [Folsomia candida]
MDMIIPTKYKSPWDSIMDVEGIQILIPIFLLGDCDEESLPRERDIPYRFFYFEILGRLREITEQGDQYKIRYRRIAKRLFDKLLDHIGVDEDLNPVKDKPLLDKTALHDFPIQTVKYNEGDTHGQ